MTYVTRGKVQITINGTTITAQISPNQDYTIKHNGENFIIFFNDSATETDIRRKDIDFIFERALIGPLTTAAVMNTCLEITIDGKGSTTIIGVKIPATLSS